MTLGTLALVQWLRITRALPNGKRDKNMISWALMPYKKGMRNGCRHCSLWSHMRTTNQKISEVSWWNRDFSRKCKCAYSLHLYFTCPNGQVVIKTYVTPCPGSWSAKKGHQKGPKCSMAAQTPCQIICKGAISKKKRKKYSLEWIDYCLTHCTLQIFLNTLIWPLCCISRSGY